MLEPQGGGDARAEAAGVYLVEQYKTRSGGTWSLSDIISVLENLRQAVPQLKPAAASYRFVTDGRPGRLGVFDAFLADVRSASAPNDLDAAERKTFGPDFSGTHREFFDHIAAVTRCGDGEQGQPESDVVFHLLSRFEMEFEASAQVRGEAIEKLLRRYAPDLGDERKIREHLIGVLVETLRADHPGCCGH